MEPYADIAKQALANLNADLTNLDAFSQQEDDEVQVELASTANDLLDQENETDSDVYLKNLYHFHLTQPPSWYRTMNCILKYIYSIKSFVNFSGSNWCCRNKH